MTAESLIPALIERRYDALLTQWLAEQVAAVGYRRDLISESDLRAQSAEFLRLFGEAARTEGALRDPEAAAWDGVREMLAGISRARALQGFSPSETATFVFSLKQTLFTAIGEDAGGDPAALQDALWTATRILDRLGLYTTELHQSSREEVISRQQQELLELSTPVVKLWEGVVAVPLIGTLDSARTQIVMESLLEQIVRTGASVAIIDITGVPTVDTLVAQHLIKTVAAARLMGAECIISGIRPQIAQTIVHLGIVLENVATKATLADAISLALKQTGFMVARAGAAPRA
jgi:rsbT co-antagonist protein RsbR